MKKSYVKLIVFEIIVLCLLLINMFRHSVINNYLIILFLIILILFFKKKFGVEKENKRYTKSLIIDISIIYIIFFVIYYLFGIITGYYKTNNYFTLYGISTFIIPNILIICFKEYFRYLVYTKFDYSKILYIITFIMFIMLDMINDFKLSSFSSIQSSFFFVAVSLLPTIVNNIVLNYIVKRSSYKVNIYWLCILNLYIYILPIIPNIGDYIMSIVRILLPLVIYGKVVSFFDNEEDKDIDRDYKKVNYIPYVVSIVFTIFLVYFTSGFFRFHAVAIASGSMEPYISKGDVVVIDKKYKELNIDDVIAYKYNGVVVVHRLVNIVEKGDKFYYTKGDANELPDNYVVNKEDIIGIVNIKIPYIGLPTVWLNEL